MRLSIPIAAFSMLSGAASLVPSRVGEFGIKQLFQFPNATQIENVAVRPNGKLLLSIFDQGRLYSYDPQTPDKDPYIAAQLPGMTGLSGIAEIAHDVFALTGGVVDAACFSFTNQTVFVVAFHDCRRTMSGHEVPSVRVVGQVPKASGLNGMVALPRHPRVILSADSSAGAIYRIDTTTGQEEIVIEDEKLSVGNGTVYVPLGINGIKLHHDYLYFTNSNQKFFGRIKMTERGYQAGDIEQITGVLDPASDIYDDFAMSKDGTAYVTVHPNYMARITPAGKQEVLVRNTTTTPQYNPTSAALSRDENTLYVVSGPMMVNGRLEGGKVLEVDL